MPVNPYKDYKPADRIAFLKSDCDYYIAQANAYKRMAERALEQIKEIEEQIKEIEEPITESVFIRSYSSFPLRFPISDYQKGANYYDTVRHL